ncbi:MAG: hypothetical protein CSA55_01215 [Ilumatobacter coccineus]|uniref:Ig-like domain-containing protein n=1 Tax=Ilumatobacter coccineus TaxID=467094 RepID=A0A2G6KF06_9ACTN|nr:MAG: hypothetical protein CSA55_01215 [Ilumatobacter coccineus]
MPRDDGVECVITNTAVTTTLHVDKVWEHPVAGDTAEITVSGTQVVAVPGTATADGNNVVSETDSDVVTVAVTSGETGMSVSESLGVGNTAVYDQVLSCVGVDNFDAVAGTFDIPQNPTDEPRCTLTNTAQRGTIVISKTVDGAGGDFTFDSDWNDSSGAAVGQFVLSPADGGTVSQTWIEVLVGQYSVAELTNAAYDQTVTCTESGAGADDGSSASGVTGSIDLDAGETVTCSYTNTERATVIVIKDADPDIDYTVLETLESNWDLDSVTCTTGVATTPVTQAGAEGVSFTPDAGQTITCTFVNDADESQLTVTKTVEGVDAAYGWDVEISLIPDPAGASPVTLSGTGNSAETVTFDDLVLNQQYTVAEVDPGPGWTASAMTCTYLGQPHADEDANRAGHQVTITEPNSTVQCGLTNTADPGSIEVSKSVENHDDDWSFDFALADSDPATADIEFTLDQGTTSYQNTQLVPGETYTLTETVPDGWSSVMTCTVMSASGATTTSAGPWAIEPGDSIECDVVNTRKTATMTVAKDWVNAADGDAASLSAVSETGTHTYVDTSPAGATDSMSFTVRASETVSLSEVMAAANTGSYSVTSLTCVGDTGTLTWTAGDLSATYEVSDDPSDLTCTWTNSRTSAMLYVGKDWGDHVNTGDTATLGIDGETGQTAVSVTATAPTDIAADGADAGSMTVFSGETVTISETVDPEYVSDLTCVDESGLTVLALSDATSGLHQVPSVADPKDVYCTFTNRLRSADLSVTKTWVNGAAGDATELSVVSAQAGTDTATSTVGETPPTSVSQSIYANTEVAISETMAGANTGSYASHITCVGDVDGDGVDETVVDENGTSASYTPGDTPVDVACTITNTRRRAMMTLRKEWVDAASGDSATIGATSEVGSSAYIDSSPAGGSDSISFPVFSGEMVSLSEVMAAGNAASYSATALTCVGDTGTLTWTTGDLSATYEVSDDPADVTCTWTNTRDTHEVSVVKRWVGALAGDESALSLSVGAQTDTATSTADGAADFTDSANRDDGVECVITNTAVTTTLHVDKVWEHPVAGDTAEITVSGTGVTPSPSGIATADGNNVVSETDSDVVTVTVTSGEAGIAISETVSSATAVYDQVLTCIGVENFDAAAGTFDVPKNPTDEPRCTFTNTAQRGTIVINKTVDGAGGDFTFTASWNDALGSPVGDVVLSPSDGGTVTQTWTDVLVGAYTVVEAVDPAYDQTVTCTESGPAADDGSSASGVTGLIDLDAGETVTCSYTNTERATVIVVKDADPDDDQAFEYAFSGGTVNETFSLVDDGSTPATNVWSTTVSPHVDYTVLETLESNWDLDSVTCDTATTPVTQAGAEGVSFTPDSGQTITCTFVNDAEESQLTVTKTVAGVASSYDWSAQISLVQQYTVAEVDPGPGWTASALNCTYLGQPHADEDTTQPGHQVTITAPGSTVRCGLTNTADPGSIEVSKSVENHDDDWSFDFALADSDPATADTEFTLDQDTTSYQNTQLVPGETYTLTETVPDGWSSVMTCTVTSAGGTTVTSAGPWAIEPGDSIECDVVNTRKTATMTVAKNWVNAADGDAASLTAISETGTHTYVDTSPAGATDSMSFIVRSGETVSLSEVMAAANTGSYSATALTCVGDTGTLTWTAGDLSATYEVSDDPSDLTCTWTNTRDSAMIHIGKTWGAHVTSGDTATLALDGETGQTAVSVTATAPTDIAADGVDAGSMTLFSGETVTISEAVGAGYVADLTCVDESGDTVVSQSGTTSETWTAPMGSDLEEVYCTFTNRLRSAELTVTKTWVGGLAGDTTDLSVTTWPSETTSATSAVGETPPTSVSASIYANTEAAIGETLATANAASYTSHITCVGDADGDGVDETIVDLDGTSTTYTQGDEPFDMTCTITNTAVTTTLHVDKVWEHPVAGDTAEITVSGTQVAAVPGTATADGNNVVSETDSDVVTVTVTSGEAGIAISETVNSATAAYDQVLTCTGVENFDAVAGTFDIPKNPTDEPRCAFTNSAQRGTIVINKTVDGAGGDFTFDSDWNDSSGAAVGQFVLSPPTAGSDSQTWTEVLVGSYSVSELTNAAYDQTVICTESGPTADDGSSASAVTGSIDLDAGETVTCSYTNTERATVIVIKDADPMGSRFGDLHNRCGDHIGAAGWCRGGQLYP